MDIREIKKESLKYTVWSILPSIDWQSIDPYTKISALQITPKKAIKKRKVWYVEVPYVTIWYVERALNFVSNFDRGIKVVDKWMTEYTKTTKKWEKKYYDARVQADCYIVLWSKRIERTVFWVRPMVENNAISIYSCYEAARSQATKSFADTLWIWSDAIMQEDEKLQKAREEAEKATEEDAIEWFTSNKQANE